MFHIPFSEAVVQRRCSEKFPKIQRKEPAMESFLTTTALMKNKSITGTPLDFCEIFQKIFCRTFVKAYKNKTE